MKLRDVPSLPEIVDGLRDFLLPAIRPCRHVSIFISNGLPRDGSGRSDSSADHGAAESRVWGATEQKQQLSASFDQSAHPDASTCWTAGEPASPPTTRGWRRCGGGEAALTGAVRKSVQHEPPFNRELSSRLRQTFSDDLSARTEWSRADAAEYGRAGVRRLNFVATDRVDRVCLYFVHAMPQVSQPQ